jgi:hypothetical protein
MVLIKVVGNKLINKLLDSRKEYENQKLNLDILKKLIIPDKSEQEFLSEFLILTPKINESYKSYEERFSNMFI